MSDNNQERYTKKCVLCEVRNVQIFFFCEKCFTEKQHEARDFMRAANGDEPDRTVGNLRPPDER
jgi:hypothetical protein